MQVTLHALLKKAVELHGAGHVLDATVLYKQVLEKYPDNVDANHNLAVTYALKNDLETAISHFKRALESNSAEQKHWFGYIEAVYRAYGIGSDELQKVISDFNELHENTEPLLKYIKS